MALDASSLVNMSMISPLANREMDILSIMTVVKFVCSFQVEFGDESFLSFLEI